MKVRYRTGKTNKTHNLSPEFVEDMYARFVKRHIDIPVEVQTPYYPFLTCVECNSAYSESCYGCNCSREAYQSVLDSIYSRPKREGARVFCVGCGASQRTLRKWYNSYLCTDCWNIKNAAGEDVFIKALEGKGE